MRYARLLLSAGRGEGADRRCSTVADDSPTFNSTNRRSTSNGLGLGYFLSMRNDVAPEEVGLQREPEAVREFYVPPNMPGSLSHTRLG